MDILHIASLRLADFCLRFPELLLFVEIVTFELYAENVRPMGIGMCNVWRVRVRFVYFVYNSANINGILFLANQRRRK